jgi:superoxide reductase
MSLIVFLQFAYLTFGQRDCDDLQALIKANSKYGKDGVFNKTNYPDAFKDLVDLHIPRVDVDGFRAEANMTRHPQTPDHYITDIWVYNEAGRMITCRKFNSSERNALDFEIPRRTGTLTVFEHCNLHGVWVSDPVEITCHDIRHDIIENQQRFNLSGIYNETHYPDAFKDVVAPHIPAVTFAKDLSWGVATLKTHPQTEDHHITDMWVVDERGFELRCEILEVGDVLSLYFDIPSHVHRVHVIEHCNLHGVWGKMFDVMN